MHVPFPFQPWEQCPLPLHGDAAPPGHAGNDNEWSVSHLALLFCSPCILETRTSKWLWARQRPQMMSTVCIQLNLPSRNSTSAETSISLKHRKNYLIPYFCNHRIARKMVFLFQNASLLLSPQIIFILSGKYFPGTSHQTVIFDSNPLGNWGWVSHDPLHS